VGRALAQLNIKHIAAYSPEARGRSERAFRTIQDRLPKDFDLAGIVDDIGAANRFLRVVFVPMYNRLFAVKLELEESAFVPAGDLAWRDVLCVQEERVVAPDNTVSWNGRRLQIPPHPSRPHFVRVTVRGARIPGRRAGDFPRTPLFGTLDSGGGRGAEPAPAKAGGGEAVAAGRGMKHDCSPPRPAPASRGRGRRFKDASRRLRRLPSASLSRCPRPREENCMAGTEEQAPRPNKGTSMGVGSVSRFRIRHLTGIV